MRTDLFDGRGVEVDEVLVFLFNDTATTEIYTLSLHDALPISLHADAVAFGRVALPALQLLAGIQRDRKSTRLNSSHQIISYAVFCLKQKQKKKNKIKYIKNKKKIKTKT